MVRALRILGEQAETDREEIMRLHQLESPQWYRDAKFVFRVH